MKSAESMLTCGWVALGHLGMGKPGGIGISQMVGVAALGITKQYA